MTDFADMLVLLVLAHLLFDFPLQGDFLARAKNSQAPIPGVPWQTALTSHAAMHAGAVYLITGAAWAASIEFIVHFVVDDMKSRGWIDFNTDQAVHLACKVLYACLIVSGVTWQ